MTREEAILEGYARRQVVPELISYLGKRVPESYIREKIASFISLLTNEEKNKIISDGINRHSNQPKPPPPPPSVLDLAALKFIDNKLIILTPGMNLLKYSPDEIDYSTYRKDMFINDDWRYLVFELYYRSMLWRSRANAVHIYHGHFCEICRKKPSIDIHHVSYDHIFNEQLPDLMALCRSCHSLVHEIRK